MTTYKCRKCGAPLMPQEDQITAVCEHCGNLLRLPRVDKELYNRANELRREKRFDQAAAMFRECISQDPQDAESHWNLLLCKFGVEYVQDKDGSFIPTCNGITYDSILEDEDYQDAVRFADEISARLYQEEAQRLHVIQQEIIRLAQKSEDFDVFISYKETDEEGGRTEDSIIAQDIYDELVRKGYKVFFSRVTLKGQAGLKYEPIIFSALNSAPVMLLVGTSPKNMESVWVKNEWTRFLNLMEEDKDKKIEVVYKGMTRINLPARLRFVPQRDLTNVGQFGWQQDISYDVDSMLEFKKKAAASVEFVRESDEDANERAVQNCYLRAEQLLEEDKKEEAKEILEQALDIDHARAETWWKLFLLVSDNMRLFRTEEPAPDETIRMYGEKVKEYAKETEQEWVEEVDNYFLDWRHLFGKRHYRIMEEALHSKKCCFENNQKIIRDEYKYVEEYASPYLKSKAEEELREWEEKVQLWKEYRQKAFPTATLLSSITQENPEYKKAIDKLDRQTKSLKSTTKWPMSFSVLNVLYMLYLTIAPYLMSVWQLKEPTDGIPIRSWASIGSVVNFVLYLVIVLIVTLYSFGKNNRGYTASYLTCMLSASICFFVGPIVGMFNKRIFKAIAKRLGMELYIAGTWDWGTKYSDMENTSKNALVQAMQPYMTKFYKFMILVIVIHIILAALCFIHWLHVKAMEKRHEQLVKEVTGMTSAAVQTFVKPYEERLGVDNISKYDRMIEMEKDIPKIYR